MSKFKVGDEVKILSVGHYYAGNLKVGDIGKITVNGKDGTYILNGEGKYCWLSGFDLELVQSKYPNPPHVHADVIIEWAKGADIVWQDDSGKGTDVWRECYNKQGPAWDLRNIYKTKPAPTPSELADIKTQAKIDKYLAKIEKLKLTLGDK